MLKPVPKPKNYCRCGCGTEIKATRKWVSGHNFRRRPPGTIVRKGRTYLEIKCSECGSKFERRSDQINRYGNVNLCSRRCVSKRQSRNRKGVAIPKARKGKYFNCVVCDRKFYRSRSYVKKATYRNSEVRFCRDKCYKKWQKETGYVPTGFISSTNNKGKNNGRYSHGKRIGENINHRELRQQVIKRDGGDWCLLCGKPGPGLHLHRIVYGSQGGKYVLENCIQLCPKDHDLVHSSKKTWFKPLIDYVKKPSKANRDILIELRLDHIEEKHKRLNKRKELSKRE